MFDINTHDPEVHTCVKMNGVMFNGGDIWEGGALRSIYDLNGTLLRLQCGSDLRLQAGIKHKVSLKSHPSLFSISPPVLSVCLSEGFQSVVLARGQRSPTIPLSGLP